MGRRDKLHNIMRLRGMSKVVGPRKWGWALQKWVEKMCPLCEWNSRALFQAANWQAQSSALLLMWCSALLVASWGDYCCAEHAVPGSATQSLKPAMLPLECLVWGQRSSRPGRDRTHIVFRRLPGPPTSLSPWLFFLFLWVLSLWRCSPAMSLICLLDVNN